MTLAILRKHDDVDTLTITVHLSTSASAVCQTGLGLQVRGDRYLKQSGSNRIRVSAPCMSYYRLELQCNNICGPASPRTRTWAGFHYLHTDWQPLERAKNDEVTREGSW